MNIQAFHPSPATPKASRTDWILTGVCFLLGVATRLPFQSHILYLWDSVNFALALDHYSIELHQPQPPGYILYVLTGRLFKLLLHDPNASLVGVSILFSGLGVAAVFMLGKSLFSREVGLFSAALMLTSPLFWFYGEVALSYVVEGFFVTLIGWGCYQVLSGRDAYLIPISVVLGIAGGYRQNTLLLMLPLWGFTVWRSPWRKKVLAGLALGVTVAAWLAIMIALAGGISVYWNGISGQTQSTVSREAARLDISFLLNALRLTVYHLYALTLGFPLLLWGGALALRRWRQGVKSPVWQIFIMWLLPSLAFYIVLVSQAGYVCTFMSGVIVILAFILVEVLPPVVRRWLPEHISRYLLLGAILCTNLVFFLGAPAFLFNQQRQLLNTTSWGAIRSRDEVVSEKVSYIRQHFAPGSTAILADQFDFRLPDYYFADYLYPALSHSLGSSDSPYKLDAKAQTLVLFDEDFPVDNPSAVRSVVLKSGERLRWIVCSPDVEVAITADNVRVTSR